MNVDDRAALRTARAARRLLEILTVAAAYYASGKLGLLLAIPPGYSTAIWPPAGIALAAILLRGYRVWPGVWLGSFLVNVTTSFDTSDASTLARSWAVPAVIGIGAGTQALAGAFLVRRWVGLPLALNRERDVGKFMALCGPVACLVGATIGVTTLVAAGIIASKEYAYSWFTWWVGDTIGALIVTPLGLMWTAAPESPWRGRRLSVVVPLGVTLGLVVVFFVYASRAEQAVIAREFDRRAIVVDHALRRGFGQHLEAVLSVETLYASSTNVERHQFRVFATRTLARHSGLKALSWNPRVRHEQRAAVEAEVRRDGFPDFCFLHLAAGAKIVPAEGREEYVPVVYIEPYDENQVALGLDVASQEDRRVALARACATGAPSATGRVKLIQETSGQFGVLVFVPIYPGGQPPSSSQERRDNVCGYVVGVLLIGDMTKACLSDTAEPGVRVRLEDASAEPHERLLHVHPSNAVDGSADATDRASRALVRTTSLEFAGRRWEVRCEPTMAFAAAYRGWQAWAALAAGLMFTALFEAFLLVSTGRAVAIQACVAEHTAELSKATQAYARLAAILEATTDFVGMVDPHGRTMWLNRGGRQMLDIPLDEDLCGSELAVYHPEWAFELVRSQGLPAALRDGIWAGETTLRRRDGREIPVLQVIIAHKDESGGLQYFSTIMRDITDRMHAEEQRLRQINEELQRKNSEIEQFMFTVTHDLKSPLVTIQGFAGHCQQDVRARQWDRLPGFLERIQAATDRMTRLIGDLLDLGRIGRVANQPVLVAMTDLLSDVVRNHEQSVRQRGVRVTVQRGMPSVRVDSDRMVQVFDNLIVNALTHGCAADDPCIEIGARLCGDECRFFVRDNGPGIPAAHHERIFEVFQRLSKDCDGTGIGLAIVRRIVEFHGGRTWVESSENQGATFWVALPQQRLEAPEKPLARQEEAYEIGACSAS